jgi:prepilin-type N-terminal cleavage/methylation domain-containing protein
MMLGHGTVVVPPAIMRVRMERAENKSAKSLHGDSPAKGKPRRAHTQRGGFTMVELLVVVGLLVLLASVFIINANSARMRAREALAANHGGAVAQAIRSYLTVWITDTPRALFVRIASQLPRADWTGAPPGAMVGESPLDRSCTGAFALIDPNGNTTSYSWPSAPREVGCVLGLRIQGGVERLRAITWSNGSQKYYVDGLSP